MPANFDWQTEEDNRRRSESLWENAPDPPGKQPSRRPPWRMISLIAVLVLIVGAVIWWRVDEYVDATLQANRTDVISSHNLVQRAVAEADEEVFRSVLSGRMPAWTAAELDVFYQQLVFDRTPLGLIPLEGSLPVILSTTEGEADAEQRPAQIELSPDMNEATVVVDHPFRVEMTGETVVLRQTSIFRRGDSRWLLAPPLDEFWGDWITAEGNYLSVIYPSRDEPIAARLAADLDEEIGRMCATLEEINCSSDLYLTVRLDTDPSSLAALGRSLGAVQRAREQGDILELPTPTLVGLPTPEEPQMAEAGYNALLAGYARHVVGAAIVQAVNWQCCNNTLLFSLLVEKQLGELGIAEWPIGAADHQKILESRTRLSDLIMYLRGRFPAEISEERMWEIRAAVDFMANGIPGMSTAELQRILGRSRGFSQFLTNVTNESRAANDAAIPNNLDLAWWLYAIAITSDETEPSVDMATETLYLSCAAADGNQITDMSRLSRYLPQFDTWGEMRLLPGFIWMSALPDPERLLMQEFNLETGAWHTNIWHDKAIMSVYASKNGLNALSFGETDPAGRRLVAYRFESELGEMSAIRIDLDECTDASCLASGLPGRPFWSPNSEAAIYMGDNTAFPEDILVTGNNHYIVLQTTEAPRNYSLTIGDGDATPGSPSLRVIDDGRAPFWLNNETYGYIRRTGSDGPAVLAEDEIVLATLNDPEPITVIPAADLYEFIPVTVPARQLSIAYVATHPRQPDKLFIVILDTRALRSYLMIYDLQTRLPEVRLDLSYNRNHSLGFSPDGRYLVLTGQDGNTTISSDNSAMLLLHEIDVNRTIPLLTRSPFFLPSVVYDWTEDSRWLAVALEDNLIGLIAPDEGFSKLLPHSYGACTSVAWVRE